MSKAGETALIRCGTTKGDFAMEMHRDWSPNGYDRAVELFERGFYDDTHFFRVVPNFLVQFGITYSTDKELKHLAHRQFPDDPQLNPRIPFEEGTISYAGSGENSRTSQLFISYGKSSALGTQKWETPVGSVIEGMEIVKNFYSYGDMPPWGKGPIQGKIHNGPSYINDNFPLTDKFTTCQVTRRPASETERELMQLDPDAAAGEGGHIGGLHESFNKLRHKVQLQKTFRKLRKGAVTVADHAKSFDPLAIVGLAVVVLMVGFLFITLKGKPKTQSKTV